MAYCRSLIDALLNTNDVATRLETYATQYANDEKMLRRIMKAANYVRILESGNNISLRQRATIKNVIGRCAQRNQAIYNSSPESEAYWCS